MPIDDQQGAVSLNLLRQRHQLAASLTDFRLIARLASCEVPDAFLAELQRDAQQLLAECAGESIGQLTLQSAARAGVDRSADAESWLRGAHACAQLRSLRLLTLRCATSLAELWRS